MDPQNMTIQQRKKDHVELTVSGEVDYDKTAGFEQFDFLHNALPEINIDGVSTEAQLLGHTFSFPLFISSMTGGYTDAGAVNAIIAEFCEANNLPFGVGSQRAMLENPSEKASYAIVREKAPNAFIASNIGGAQLIGGLSSQELKLLIDSIEADAVIVHLNPLQELMQPEGDRNFKGVEAGIAKLVKESPVPVIVKETGAGISAQVAGRLLDAGVSVIDIAGAGGTSWAKVENERSTNQKPDAAFNDWGIPTIECLVQVNQLKKEYDFELIASGGIRSSFDLLKSVCLGADFGAAAQPVIKSIVNDGYEGLEALFERWKYQAKVILTLTGTKNVNLLTKDKLIHS
ncbi:type 2 isopentenyl-diphosphate Delta-isomerase [Aliifodinibius sp. S!AR15-10]|uniref:type 2 isopentenyl-diphosphate Delta-isomerase n=1 Tax=Aliifodinibius sp. S!AR15-10 TaxID=2950437 RepID=UPI002856F16A|nr:type 2 isopentenyl-diphosphate Delta-isomerase [Aliifodinibius sp. S!AR15-10]MDR8391571.1 type 2 isopentenyl-diphosphate Delta-isomerase [Aliifodinibius sp. S!AR15-10]